MSRSSNVPSRQQKEFPRKGGGRRRRHAPPPGAPPPPAAPHRHPSPHLSVRRTLLLVSTPQSATAVHCRHSRYPLLRGGVPRRHLRPHRRQALQASKKVSHHKSASNPNAVLAHLSGVGLSRTDLAAVVAAEPQLLRVRADNIARRIAALRDRMGLSDPQIGSLLLAGGAMDLRKCDIASRLEFWIPFLGTSNRQPSSLEEHHHSFAEKKHLQVLG